AVLACGGWPAGRGWGAWMGGRGVGRVGGRWRPGSVAPAGVRVRRRRQGRVPGRSGVVAGLVHDDQVAVRPGVVEPPHDAEEVAEVEAALDQGAGNALEEVRVPQDDALVGGLAQEVVVAPVVGDGTGEA